RAAGADIARIVRLKSRRFGYCLDCGNLADRGQFVLGQPLRKDRKDRAGRLPSAHELFPSIVDRRADKRERLPACSAAEALERQLTLREQHHRKSCIGFACEIVSIRQSWLPRGVCEPRYRSGFTSPDRSHGLEPHAAVGRKKAPAPTIVRQQHSIQSTPVLLGWSVHRKGNPCSVI